MFENLLIKVAPIIAVPVMLLAFGAITYSLARLMVEGVNILIDHWNFANEEIREFSDGTVVDMRDVRAAQEAAKARNIGKVEKWVIDFSCFLDSTYNRIHRHNEEIRKVRVAQKQAKERNKIKLIQKEI